MTFRDLAATDQRTEVVWDRLGSAAVTTTHDTHAHPRVSAHTHATKKNDVSIISTKCIKLF